MSVSAKVPFCLLVVVLSGGCRRAIPPEPDRPHSLTIAIQDNTVCALLLIARGEGFFDAEGLDVSMHPYASGKLALDAMLAGEADLATAADLPIMSKAFERKDYCIVATIAGTGNGAWIVARRDRGIQSPSDLKGKRVATQEKSAVHFFLSMFLLHNGMAEDDVDLSYMNAVELPKKLVSGEIDAFSMRNPFIAQAVQELGTNAVEFFEPDIYGMTFNLVAFRALVEKEPALLVRVLRALRRAEIIVHEEPERALVSAARGLGDGREAEARADWSRYDYELRLDQSILLTLEEQARWAVRRGLTQPGIPQPNFLEFIHADALREVKPDAVTVIQ